MKLFNDTDGHSKLNLTSNQLKDMEKFVVTVTVKQSSRKGVKQFDHEIMKINVDSCKISKGAFRNFFINAVYDAIKEVSNFRLSCPQLKGNFYTRNLPMIDNFPFSEKFLMERSTGDFEISSVIRGKPYNMKKSDNVCNQFCN
ncbi:CLUMA_CG004081, isoform A [Clunio marinus]|uniref:CLUMA_CG004081, isoform A n=1 Tax=Clunio marinus TaxID=568069 RepID=A0A1J1HQS9_9DIPT|nr:CLUMA_CG004081, isoform A [Clunio marinus]